MERSHRTLNSILAKTVSENQRNWHEVLDLVVAAYNATSHDSTKFSPNYLMYGRETNMPIDLIACASNVEPEATIDEYVEHLRHNLTVAYDSVRKNTKKAAERQKRYYDAKVRGIEYTAGELVLIYYPRSYKNRSKKWTSGYIGPCMVTRRINAVNYVIKKSPKSRESVVHVDRLKRYPGRITPVWEKCRQSLKFPTEQLHGANEPVVPVDPIVPIKPAEPIVPPKFENTTSVDVRSSKRQVRAPGHLKDFVCQKKMFTCTLLIYLS